MPKIHLLKGIVLIFTIILVTLACATNKTQPDCINTGLNAINVPEGILLVFDIIPEETASLFISFSNWDDREILTGTHDIISAHTVIRECLLEQVKQTRRVIFPFARPGEKYHIYVSFWKDGDWLINGFQPDYITTGIIAENGIYIINEMDLTLNDTHTSVTLSTEPVFSAAVKHAPIKYGFAAVISLDDYRSLGFNNKSSINGFHWDFEPNMTLLLREDGHLQSGNYPAYVTAFSSLIHDGIIWDVEIAKTPVFIYIF